MAKAGARKLTEGPVFGHIARFVIPMTVGISANFLVALIDAYWLGRLGEQTGSTAPLAAVGVTFHVIFAIFAVAIGLSAGAVAVVSKAVGADDREAVRQLSTDTLILGVLVAVVVTAVGYLLTPTVFRWMGATGEVLDLAVVYMRVWLLGLVFIVGPVIANAILRALGRAVLPSVLMVSTAFVNMILDPLLIFGIGPFPRLEVAGAALATVGANVVAALAFGVIMVRQEKLLALAGVTWARLKSHWGPIAKIGGMAALSTGVNPIAMAIVSASILQLGDDIGALAMAAFTAAGRVETLAVIPLFALSAAIGPITGQNAAAGLNDRVRRAFTDSFAFSIAWAVGAAAFLAAVGWIATGAIIGGEGEAQAEAWARWYLWLVPATMAGYGVVMAASAGFNGLSRPGPALAFTVFRSLGLIAPAAWLGGVITGGPIGVFVGIAVANVISGVVVAGWTLLVAFPRRRADVPTSPANA